MSYAARDQAARLVAIIATSVALARSSTAHAQLAGDLERGQDGLTVGTQPAPGLVLTGSVYDYYTAQIIAPNGHAVHTTGSYDTYQLLAVSVWYVSPLKILGANYGAVLSLWGTSSATEFPRLNVDERTNGFGDMYLKPFELGWHATYLDALAGFALWIPTGRYSPDGDDNTGQGQWGYEFSAGATLWLEKDHHFNVATQAYYDIYSPKLGGTIGPGHTALRTGDILTLMGGVGYQMIDGALDFGIPYFVQWKVTDDTLPPGVGAILPGIQTAKDWSMGVGAEVDVSWSKTDSVSIRFLQGLAGANTTDGQSYILDYSRTIPFGGT